MGSDKADRKWWFQRVTAFVAVKPGSTDAVLRDGLGKRLLVQPLIPRRKMQFLVPFHSVLGA